MLTGPDCPPFSWPCSFRIGKESWGHTRSQQCPEIWVSVTAVLRFLQPSWHKAVTNPLKPLEQNNKMMREQQIKVDEQSGKKCVFLLCCASLQGVAKCLSLMVVSRWLQKGCFWQLYSSLVFLSFLLFFPCQEARGTAAALTFKQ